MAYQVLWSPVAVQQVSKLPKKIGDRITTKVETYLAMDPNRLGESLLGGFSGFKRYRIGDYRVIYEILNDTIAIHIIRVGHRKDVYED